MEDPQPQFDDRAASMVIGKHVLVGVTYLSPADEVFGHEQFHGTIVRASNDGIVVQLAGSEEERWLPPDLSRLESAAPGEYRLRSTGEVVVDPDFLSTWHVYPPDSGEP